SAPSSPGPAAPGRRPGRLGSGCRCRAGSPARAVGTSSPARARAAPSCSRSLRSTRRPSIQSGKRKVVSSTLGDMTTTTMERPASFGRTMLNKVPEVTLYFWIIKIMCTTVGETAADYLNDTLGFGLTNTTYVTGALLAVLLLAQFRLRKYVPAIYWSVVVVISVFGTLITDNMTDLHNIPLTTST